MNKMLTSRACASGLFFIACIFALISCSDNGNRSGEESKFVFMGNAPVIFSEIHAANVEYEDEFGEKPGWVEFYNPADTAVNLKGYSLANASNANGALWTFGDVVVQPLSYLTVFFSGRDRPNLGSPSDSIDLIDRAVDAWNVAGNTQHVFSKNTGISGTIVTTANLTRSAIMLKFKGRNENDAIDISKNNQILLRGYLSENSNLRIRLAQEGIEESVTWSAIIIGTGKENDLYKIELPSTGFPDLRNIYGICFENANPRFDYGTIDFSFSSIIAQKRGSDIHVSFELNESGGKLFLIDSRQQIKDSVAYPAAVINLSFAKNFENGKWAFSKPPTPNSANSYESYKSQAQQIAETSIPKSGYFENALSFTLPAETEHGIIHCDTSGAIPNEKSVLKSGSTLNLTKTSVLRCAQFKQGAYQSEPLLRTYIIGERLPSLPVVSIAVNPIDMFDPITGLYSMGPNAGGSHPYYGANFWKDIELPIQIDFFESGAKHEWSHPAGIKIRGRHSRGWSKKSVDIGFKGKYGLRNLRYSLFPEHPNLTKFNWFILRNNGGNYNKGYIHDMLMTSLTEGLEIDYQKGRFVIVYYNGKYFGIHDLRERSNADYFDTNYGIDENDIDLVNIDEVSRGSDVDYQDILNWLGNVALDDENLEQLRRRIDLDNYTNYLQSEIYFSNKDWLGGNLKRWRSRAPVSKWKWLLFDTDNGFGDYDPAPQIKMLVYVTDPNAPNYPFASHSTLLINKLLENQNYKNAFINRFSLLLATYYAPARVEARINALMYPIENEIPLDQQRWNQNPTYMNNQLTVIRNFGKNRSAEMQSEIKEFFRLGNPIDLTLTANGNGKILVHNLPVLNNNATFKVYSTVPITIKAVPNAGTIFSGWSDGNKSSERTIAIEQTTTLKADFF